MKVLVSVVCVGMAMAAGAVEASGGQSGGVATAPANTSAASRPAAVAGAGAEAGAADMRTWLVDVPAKALTVNVSYPAGWTNKKDATGKPEVMPPGAEDSVLPARWTFDIKTDPKSRPMEELVALYVKAFEANKQAVKESKVIDMADGRKAGMIVYTMTAGGQEVTIRNMFIPLGGGQVIMTDEQALTSEWKNVEGPFEKMSLAVKATAMGK